jgi:hypothetical protein
MVSCLLIMSHSRLLILHLQIVQQIFLFLFHGNHRHRVELAGFLLSEVGSYLFIFVMIVGLFLIIVGLTSESSVSGRIVCIKIWLVSRFEIRNLAHTDVRLNKSCHMMRLIVIVMDRVSVK